MKKKGFSIIELLAVLVILGIIGLIAVVSYSSYIKNAREKAYEQLIENMKTAAANYVIEQQPSFSDNEEQLQANELIEKKYLESLIDPVSQKSCDLNLSFVDVTKQAISGEISDSVDESIQGVNEKYNYKVCLSCNSKKLGVCKGGITATLTAKLYENGSETEELKISNGQVTLPNETSSIKFIYNIVVNDGNGKDEKNNLKFNPQKLGYTVNLFSNKVSESSKESNASETTNSEVTIEGKTDSIDCNEFFETSECTTSDNCILKIKSLYNYKSSDCKIRFHAEKAPEIEDKVVSINVNGIANLIDPKQSDNVITLKGKYSKITESYYQSTINIVGVDKEAAVTFKDLECRVPSKELKYYTDNEIEFDNEGENKNKITCSFKYTGNKVVLIMYAANPGNDTKVVTPVVVVSKNKPGVYLVYRVKSQYVGPNKIKVSDVYNVGFNGRIIYNNRNHNINVDDYVCTNQTIKIKCDVYPINAIYNENQVIASWNDSLLVNKIRAKCEIGDYSDTKLIDSHDGDDKIPFTGKRTCTWEEKTIETCGGKTEYRTIESCETTYDYYCD